MFGSWMLVNKEVKDILFAAESIRMRDFTEMEKQGSRMAQVGAVLMAC